MASKPPVPPRPPGLTPFPRPHGNTPAYPPNAPQVGQPQQGGWQRPQGNAPGQHVGGPMLNQHRVPGPPPPVGGPPPQNQPAQFQQSSTATRGTLPVIGAANIAHVESMDANGGASLIWKVELTSGDKLVVKREKMPEVTAAWLEPRDKSLPMSPTNRKDVYTTHKAGPMANANANLVTGIMGRASPTAALELLGPTELTALQMYAGAPDDIKGAVRDTQAKHFVMVKMKLDTTYYASHRDLDDGGDLNGQVDITNSETNRKAKRLFEQLLGHKKAWFTLGEIIIADALIGNNDRIDFRAGEVSNFGNLIFSQDPSTKKITHALGYDALDPSGGNATLLYGSDVSLWKNDFGQFIHDRKTLSAFAQKVIAYINRERMAKLGLKALGGTETTALADGMKTGWDKQGKAFAAMVKSSMVPGSKTRVPSGMMGRAVYMGWVR